MATVFAAAWLLSGAVLAGAPAQPLDTARDRRPPIARDACALLGAEDIRAIQGVALTELKRSSETARGLQFAQCFFATKDFAHSISLTVTSGGTPAAVRDYWQGTFHRSRPPDATPTARAVSAGRKKDPPRSIAGAGDEAFWTGDARAGALYVLRGDTVLRISVGGVADQDERLRRTMALANLALKRLEP
jgi:hypothetical protein